LLGPETCCGHITIVSARLLGLPIITTASRGTVEYTEDFDGTVVVPAGDTDRLQEAILHIREDLDGARTRSSADAAVAQVRYGRGLWADYVSDFLERVA
jgi:glycosyltransferase involved in cell wall biosynthesis